MIDPRGQIVARAGSGKRRCLVARIRPAEKIQTLNVRFADWPGPPALGLLLGLLGLARRGS